MISEKTREEGDFLSAWVIHFFPAGSKTSVFREKLMNPSNIHFWENTTRVEGNQFDFIYFLTQMFLTKDIETLQRIILEPEEIHELVQQTISVRKSLNEYGEFDETSYRTEIDRMPYIGCNFIDEKCISFELLVTDHFDPDHNLRNLLGDLRTSRTVTRNATQEGRDAFCVTSHNSTKYIGDKEDTQSPHSQKSKEFWRKGSRNRDPTVVQEDIITSQSPSESQTSKSVANNSPQITQKRSRKRRRSSCDRKSFQGKIPKMNTIDTYFKPIPKGSQRGYIKNKKENERSNSRELEIYIIDDDDCDSSNEFTRNVLHNDHMGREKQNFLIDELHSLEIDCFQEDISLTEKSRTSSLKSIESEESDTDICATHETLQDCHAKQVTESSAMNAEKLLNSTLASPVVCSENHDTHATISMDANNIDLYPNVKSTGTFKLDAVTRKLIRDWCGGDTFLTQDSSDRTTDDDDDDDDNGNKHDNQNNGKIDDDGDNSGDNDNNNVIHRHPDDHKGHCENDKGDEKSDDDDDDDDSEDKDDNDVLNRDPDDCKGHGESDKSVENSDDDSGDNDDSDDDESDDGDDESDNDESDHESDDGESDDDSDEDYIYDSDDKSDSDSDDIDKKRKV